MKFEPKRPIAFFDTETTDKEAAKARIIEISIIKLFPDGSTKSLYFLLNPGIKIPAESTEIHGITDEKVKDKPKFEEVAQIIYDFIVDADLGGYNIASYDVPLLCEEFGRVNMVYPLPDTNLFDACSIFFKKEERTLAAASKFYLGQELDGAHGAQADTIASIKVFLAQLERYDDLKEMDYSQIVEFCKRDKRMDYAGKVVRNEKNRAVFTFGKHKDTPLLEVFAKDGSYYSWCMRADFTKNTKQVITTIYEWYKQNKLAK